MALTEYVEGRYRLELAEAQAEIKKAEAELALAEDRNDAARTDKTGVQSGIAKKSLVVAQFALELRNPGRNS